MPIVFSAVACDRNIVANFASCDGNFTEIADQVVSKVPPCNNKMTYSHGIYLLHYIAEDEYLYFCITDKLCQRSRAFLFLNEIQRRYIASKETKEDFTTTLAAEMYRYSEDYSTIVIRKGELDELNSIGVGCSETLLGEKILYINNPDNISYTIVSQVSVSPGFISVSGVSPTPEKISVASPTLEKISVISPTLQRISPVRSTDTLLSESNTPVEIYCENSCGKKLSNRSEEEFAVVSPAPEKIISADPEKESVKRPTSGNLPAVSQNSEVKSKVTSTPVSSPDKISPVYPNYGNLSTVSPTTETIPEVSPRLYIVIIGMIMLVIAMSVYAFGPISCVVVTSIAIYSLLRSYLGAKDKSE